jgi:hypothetical protein
MAFVFEVTTLFINKLTDEVLQSRETEIPDFFKSQQSVRRSFEPNQHYLTTSDSEKTTVGLLRLNK